ncbi:glycosyltransferase [Candidatus Regiella endosymbiont of Tuberolachnus salignus]|uniref:glycosyltransferase n=1 Tax=Candidatus Regiella endosymbiont of Tuberolachnus salignus TaxID=3077956 RepID=UPI0030D5C56B
MRIVIDLQGAQGVNQHRGIGRSALYLAQAIVRNRGKHQIFLAINGLFPDTIEPIRAAFDSLLSQENICVWQSPEPVHQLDEANTWRRHSAELVREAFLASLKPDIVLVCSLFEGLDDNSVTSIGALNCTVPTAVILHDLIPLIYPRHYLINPQHEACYQRKLDHLRRADLLLAVSEASQQDAINRLGFPAEACINISSASVPYFQLQNTDSQLEKNVRQRYGLYQQFVMYTGGIDYRKNIEGLIRAYAKLPRLLRSSHQLAIVCSIQPSNRSILEELAKEQGLDAKELVLTGFVPEEDLLTLYNLCKTFVFPSWYEGFGLPVLEAMACGRAVIGANTSSLPEVIGKEEALFDPFNDNAIAEKLTQVLTDDSFRLELEQHGLAQAKRFSWDSTAQRAITAMETLHIKQASQSLTYIAPISRPKLAYVSPLPPERSGISDYSAELLPELARHYVIDVIVAQHSVSDPWIQANCQIRSLEWFRTYANHYDRVLYHFGNSPFHQHMFPLIEEIPGIVVLHDFFLGNLLAHMEGVSYQPNAWTQALYQSHGYTAVQQRFYQFDTTVLRYPCNLTVLDNARGVIVHAEHTQLLANKWYGRKGTADDWTVIPLLRVPALNVDRVTARRQLELTADDFVVCSFGILGPSKLNHRLLTAWLASDLAKSNNCVLVFVGENPGGDYGTDLITIIRNSGLKKRIHITGWVSRKTFCHYLAAADITVQLRAYSRGETSATVLDAMNYALPTIVNANGSMAELPDDSVWKLPDEFSDAQLIEALETLWHDPFCRQRLGKQAQKIIHTQHVPRHCADKYAQSIENMYRTMHAGVPALTNALAEIQPATVDPNAWLLLANAIGQSIPPKLRVCQLFVDISELIQRDARSGVQRVTRSILHELLSNPPAGYRIEPVYAESDGKGYRYARNYTLNMLNCFDAYLGNDDIIDFYNGDLFLGLDLQHNVVLAHQWFYQQMRNYGVLLYFVAYDLLPIYFPYFWPRQTNIDKMHDQWLEIITTIADGTVCISQAVASELTEWLKTSSTRRLRPLKIDWFHLGADIDASLPSKGMASDAKETLHLLTTDKNFLMVGTLEPRKGHTQALEAFEQLWTQGIAVNLVIVGKQGWIVETLVEKLRHHPQLGKQLFWLEGISDEYLEKIYDVSSCLIAASEGEGFGLPLIEAAQHKLPIIARNIPVFREVAGDHAYYFNGLEPSDLAQAIQQWLKLDLEHRAPSSEHMPWLTWAESTQQLLAKILPST